MARINSKDAAMPSAERPQRRVSARAPNAKTVPSDVLKEIVRRILTVSSPEKVIVFGSAAEGSMTPDSDIDLLVVEPSVAGHRIEYARAHRAAIGDIGWPVDVLTIGSQWYHESKDVVGGIAYPAHHRGRTIFERA
jgi:predicted nucleotidyltransferase